MLKEIIREMAAAGSTGAGSIASVPGGLFNGGVIYNPYKKWGKTKKKKGNVIRRYVNESLGLTTDETNFNAADVVSKLDAAEKKIKAEEDTVSFGLEDDEGNLVRVYVRADQAKDFENALAGLLGEKDSNDDDLNSSLEIAEVLYELKDKFEIVDVNWGVIPADEEEEQEVEGDEDPEMQADMQNPEGDEMGGMDAEMDPNAMGMGGEDESMKSTLQQVIDMLKANAEAQKAEAKAREAEAKAKEAEYAAKAAESKIRQEEEVLDMEAYYDKKNEQSKEAKKLAKLAKFKHDKARDAESTLSGGNFESIRHDMEMADEEEESNRKLTPAQLADAIFRSLRSR